MFLKKILSEAVKRNSYNCFLFSGGLDTSILASLKTIFSVKQNPDVIIITTIMGIVGKEKKKIWQKYKTISAVRNDRIYIVDFDKFRSSTPV